MCLTHATPAHTNLGHPGESPGRLLGAHRWRAAEHILAKASSSAGDQRPPGSALGAPLETRRPQGASSVFKVLLVRPQFSAAVASALTPLAGLWIFTEPGAAASCLLLGTEAVTGFSRITTVALESQWGEAERDGDNPSLTCPRTDEDGEAGRGDEPGLQRSACVARAEPEPGSGTPASPTAPLPRGSSSNKIPPTWAVWECGPTSVF